MAMVLVGFAQRWYELLSQDSGSFSTEKLTPCRANCSDNLFRNFNTHALGFFCVKQEVKLEVKLPTRKFSGPQSCRCDWLLYGDID